MCWHRQRITIPENAVSSPSLTAQHHLRFAYCVKFLGYIRKDNDVIICRHCYNNRHHYNKTLILFRVMRKLIYVPAHSHFVLDGLRQPKVSCQRCSDPIFTLRPLHECNDCTREHLRFLTAEEERGIDINNYRDPLTLHISGNYVDISWLS